MVKFLKVFSIALLLIQFTASARYYNSEMGRFINRDPIANPQDPRAIMAQNSARYRSTTNRGFIQRDSSSSYSEPSGYHDGMSLYNGYFAETFGTDPTGKWTRKAKGQPQLLDGKNADYIMKVDQIIPNNPNNAIQWAQIVEIAVVALTKNCELKSKKRYLFDYGLMLGVSWEDTWMSNHTAEWGELCFVVESTRCNIFALDPKKPMLVMNGKTSGTAFITQKGAQDGKRMAVAPKNEYFGSYTYLKKENCKCCPLLDRMLSQFNIPDGEHLTIQGAGSWSSK